MQKINKLRQTRTSFNIKKPKHYNKTNKKQAQRSMQYKWDQTTIYDNIIKPRQLTDNHYCVYIYQLFRTTNYRALSKAYTKDF